MLKPNNSRVSKTLLFSTLCAAVFTAACNDSNAANSNKAPAPVMAEANQGLNVVTSSSDINSRNHVCFTMDVNNVKCVLGDTVAYVPQPILDEKKDASEDKKADGKNNNKKDQKEEQSEQEAQMQAQLIANQNALNEARSLVFVAKYCDMSKSIVYSKEGVACTFKPHALYDAGAVAEATQYQMNLLSSEEFFKQVAALPGVEKFQDAAFGPHGGYRLFLERGAKKDGLKIGADTSAVILTKRIDKEGNVLGFYHEELNFVHLNPQMKILTAGLGEGDHVKLVFDTTLQNEQPLWRTSSLEFGQPYIWEVQVQSVSKYDPSKEQAQQQQQQQKQDSAAAEKPEAK